MSKTLYIAENPLEPETWVTLLDVNDVCLELQKHFGDHFPVNARIYYGQVALDRDVTPKTEAEIIKLQDLDGEFYVIVFPAGPILAIISIVISVVSIAVMFLLMPGTPKNTLSSSNNDLSARENKARPLSRIADIWGQVRSTPDAIAVAYRVFESNIEVEYGYYCISRGSCDVSDIRENITLLSQIAGSSAEVYAPSTSPNYGSPQLTIGAAIATPVKSVKAISGVNGQTLHSPNYKYLSMSTYRAVYPNRIESTASNPHFEKYFTAGDSIVLTNFNYNDGSGHVVNLNGTYFVSFVDTNYILLASPTTVTTDWNILNSMSGHHTGAMSATGDATGGIVSPVYSGGGTQVAGPFTIDNFDQTQIYCNFVALQGVYDNNGSTQHARSVTIEIDVTPVDVSGVPSGATETFSATLTGSTVDQSQIGYTAIITPSFVGRCSIQVWRVTASDYLFAGTVTDEIKWRDCYAVAPVAQTHFGNVTTIQTKTRATQGALSQSARKLNMLVTRKMLQRSGSIMVGPLTASRKMADIFVNVALDPYIGNRDISELDIAGIYDTQDDVEDYFNDDIITDFGYTFDNDQTSYEETAVQIADAAFCNPYRQGNLIKLSFEKLQSNSTLLFNHRNKLPSSETRTVRFGNLDSYDGVELNYVDKVNYDAIATVQIPADGSAIKPQKIDTVGIRNFRHAYRKAYRAYNKIKYQNITTQFNCTAEAALLTLFERILVADNTRSSTQDGEVISQSGLVLTLSQDIVFVGGHSYKIFLQLPDGSIQTIAITAGSAANKVVLAGAPSISLALNDDLFARTTYWIVANDDGREQAFLLAEKAPNDGWTYKLTAVNYDARYYANDQFSSIGLDSTIYSIDSTLFTMDSTL